MGARRCGRTVNYIHVLRVLHIRSMYQIDRSVGDGGGRVSENRSLGYYLKPFIQGYPQRMRLQRRLHGICLVHFLVFKVLAGQKWLISVLNHLVDQINTPLSVETRKQASTRHIFGVSGRLYSFNLL